MSRYRNINLEYAKDFVRYCKNTFPWENMSGDRVLDIGCGAATECSSVILENFPDVHRIFAIDKEPAIVQRVRARPKTRIECFVGDIEKRTSLQRFEGQITKVVSTRCFQQLENKRIAFENVYHLLQPTGQAAISLVRSSHLVEWAKEMFKNPKWKEMFQADVDANVFLEDLGQLHYQKMAQEIGFQVIDCSEWGHALYYESKSASDDLHQSVKHFFKVPAESLQEFKDDSLQNFIKTGSIQEGCIRSLETNVFILLVKPIKRLHFVMRPKMHS